MTSGSKVFLTGGTGFLGSRVLPALRRRGFHVVALDRSGRLRAQLGRERVNVDRVEIVIADLMEPERYREALGPTDVVMHLAAQTGRATAEEHIRVNAQGTEALLDECRRAGVAKILFVSSIAAKFPDTRRYPYALAKVRAEAAVRASRLLFTIVRPTIIIGPGSPVLAALENLATLPVIPVFGDGRALVQPVYVDDLAEDLVAIVEHDRFRGETLELGGPTKLTIQELLHAIRRARTGGNGGRALHIPLGVLMPPLQIAESLGLGGLLPINVGQLSSFRFDGTVQSNSLRDSRRTALRSLQEMLSLSLVSSDDAHS
jgi:nucleoside-diphosphate-sugar epimerase